MRSDLLVCLPVEALFGLMECSGLNTVSCLEANLALSDDDRSLMVDLWSELSVSNPRQCLLSHQYELRLSTSCTSNKWPVEESVDSPYVDYLPPVAKTAKRASALCDVIITQLSLPRPNASSPAPSRPSSHLPAFAPREDYIKFSFSGNPSTDTKLRMLFAVTRTFQLQRDLAEVKMASVTSRFVYISRQRMDIIDRVKSGEFLSLSLISREAS